MTEGRNGTFDRAARSYDAVIVVSFGGPEGPDDVLPFLSNVLRGRNVPRERMLEVAQHYQKFGGVSPINAQNRALVEALSNELANHGLRLPVYFGNRNWHPLLADTVRQMRDDGVRHAVAFVTSGFSCYSGCRQYREDISHAREQVPDAPVIDKLRVFYNHPGFIAPCADNVAYALGAVPAPRRVTAHTIFTTHSIPIAMAQGSRYEMQLCEAARLVAERVGIGPERYRLAYQSRSGPPQVPWLEPDILATLSDLKGQGVTDVVVMPIGFVSDHIEVVYDLDTEAADKARQLGLNMVRAKTVGTSPLFAKMIRDLIVERMTENPKRLALGADGASHDICGDGCCLYEKATG